MTMGIKRDTGGRFAPGTTGETSADVLGESGQDIADRVVSNMGSGITEARLEFEVWHQANGGKTQDAEAAWNTALQTSMIASRPAVDTSTDEYHARVQALRGELDG